MPPETESGSTFLKILAILSESNPDIKPLTGTQKKNWLLYLWKDIFICRREAERVETTEEENIFTVFKDTGEHWRYGSISGLEKQVWGKTGESIYCI